VGSRHPKERMPNPEVVIGDSFKDHTAVWWIFVPKIHNINIYKLAWLLSMACGSREGKIFLKEYLYLILDSFYRVHHLHSNGENRLQVW
jgi:hypothetical protein